MCSLIFSHLEITFFTSFYILFLFFLTDKAYEILQDMESNGPEPNIYTYNTVTRAFAQAGRLEVTFDYHTLYLLFSFFILFTPLNLSISSLLLYRHSSLPALSASFILSTHLLPPFFPTPTHFSPLLHLLLHPLPPPFHSIPYRKRCPYLRASSAEG